MPISHAFLIMAPLLLSADDGCGRGHSCDLVHACHPGPDGILAGGLVRTPSRPGSPLAGGVDDVETIESNGPVENRIDLVFVGDGYLENQLSSYAARCRLSLEELFQEEPFTSYRPFFNAHRVDVISAESGVDNDPTQGIERNTALDMGFWCSGIERLLCVSVNAANSAANAAPDIDQIFAVANSTKYGGAGYTSADIATFSSDNSSSMLVAIHELGHSLGELADEYDYGGGSTWTGGEVSETNVSIRTAAEMLDQQSKWFRWIGFSQPGLGNHDTFEGARYYEQGIFRPTSTSMMRELSSPFNMPSREGLIIEFSKIVDLRDSQSPAASTVPADGVASVVAVEPLHGLQYRWFLDGAEISGATDPAIDLTSIAGLEEGAQLTIEIVDQTPMVRDQDARATWMTRRVTWTVDAPETPDPDLNGDGRVDGADLGIMLAYWGSTGTDGDLDGDGDVDGGDLGLLLVAWTG